MRETARALTIEEAGSDQCSTSLDAVFVSALPDLAALLAGQIRAGLDNGRYVVENATVNLAEEKRVDAA
jgi:hypothetical protein